jgi:hypothetical protein
MSSRAALNSKPAGIDIPLGGSGALNPNISELKSRAVQGLVPMFNAEKSLFCDRLVRTEQGLVQEGVSRRYTIMTLLGLRELEQTGANSPFDIRTLYDVFVRDIRWIDGAGNLGLLIWLCAKFAPDQLEGLFRRVDVQTALDRYQDARHARTMELAWFLAGLAHAALADPDVAPELEDLAVQAYHRMKGNQGEYGFFGHMSTRESAAGRLRGRVGSFADQVYPIYAMSKFASAFNVEEPLCSALDCAGAICGAQGELGQWWWLYDSRTGSVSSRYPVYSVHQHGMAPMGLLAVEEALGQSFRPQIYKGLRWIYGFNELSADMQDSSHNVVWRCIRPKSKQTKYWDTALSLIRPPKENDTVGPLEILFEIRPYELGWLLYALAGL